MTSFRPKRSYAIKLKRWRTVDSEFILLKWSKQLCQYLIKKPEFPYEKIKRTIWSTCFRWLFTTRAFENPDFKWTFEFPSVIVTGIIKLKQTLHQVPGSIKKATTTTEHQFESVHFICSIDASSHSFLQHFIDCIHWCVLNALHLMHRVSADGQFLFRERCWRLQNPKFMSLVRKSLLSGSGRFPLTEAIWGRISLEVLQKLQEMITPNTSEDHSNSSEDFRISPEYFRRFPNSAVDFRWVPRILRLFLSLFSTVIGRLAKTAGNVRRF